jgi:hypothetical protein
MTFILKFKKYYIFEGIFLHPSAIIPEGLASQGALNNYPNVWLNGARPDGTCIPPSFLGNVPMQPCSIPNQKYVCEYKKLA